MWIDPGIDLPFYVVNRPLEPFKRGDTSLQQSLTRRLLSARQDGGIREEMVKQGPLLGRPAATGELKRCYLA